MTVKIVSREEAQEIIKTATPCGYSVGAASGQFLQGYRLATGEHLDHYLNFGWLHKFILYPAGHVDQTPKWVR